MSCWNIAEAVYLLGESETADNPALIHDREVISYRELRRRACGIAAYLLEQGLPHGAHVGHYMRNSNAYMESFVGSGLAGLSHLNVNYRYQDEELLDLCNGLDIQVLIFDAEFADRVQRIKDQFKYPCLLIQVGGDAPTTLESLYDWPQGNFKRRTSSDDLMLVATGGTTGLPKGVQWRHEDIWRKQNVSTGVAMAPLGLEAQPDTIEEHVANVAKLPPSGAFLTLSPLMHGAGLLMAILLLVQGTAIATIGGERFDPDATLEGIKYWKMSSMVLVGDAFALPLVDALDKRPDEGLIDSLLMLVSSGASLSSSCSERLLKHKPGLIVFDTLGSTESSGYAMSTAEAGVFIPNPTTRVLNDKFQEIEPGSDEIGIAYSAGYLPLGYYNAPEQTAETFVTIEGQRYVRTGDRCTVREDGMLVLLGRDSTVVNTGGEKVYTVEVERVLLEYPAISDVIVVGLPHPRFGKQVAAVIEGPDLDGDSAEVEAIQQFAREKLADYKVPRVIITIDSLRRAPNGKPDYPFVNSYAQEQAQAKGLV